MKLIRFGEPHQEKPGMLLPDGSMIDISSEISDFTPEFLASGGIEKLKAIQDNPSNFKEINQSIRLGPPLKGISKIVCVGLNYRKHAIESGMDIPSEPVLFFKATSAICGPNDQVIIPKNSNKTDWEVELGVIIGKNTSYVSENEAMDYVAGYVLHNDLSEREFQLEKGGQWVKGKSCDTFAPLGPWFVTKDEIADPHNLNLWLKVNGELKQDSNTSDLVFNIPILISYISQFMTLLPGDIISTGTPSGVGLGHNPPLFLKPGDVIELGIEGLGIAKQNVISFSSKT